MLDAEKAAAKKIERERNKKWFKQKQIEKEKAMSLWRRYAHFVWIALAVTEIAFTILSRATFTGQIRFFWGSVLHGLILAAPVLIASILFSIQDGRKASALIAVFVSLTGTVYLLQIPVHTLERALGSIGLSSVAPYGISIYMYAVAVLVGAGFPYVRIRFWGTTAQK